MSAPTDRITELIWDVAERAVRPRWRSLSDGQIHEKAPGDLVTVADREAEFLLTEALQAMEPGVLIVGEEATAADPTLLDRLAAADHAYLVDPVDGTKNFVEGKPDYALMVGEVRGGVPVRGWIIQPEHDRTYVAEQGGGVTCNGERMSRPVTDPSALRGATSHRRLIGEVAEGVADPIGFTFFSCGIDYPHMISGGTDFLVYRNMKPWDHVPGVLMLRELGGTARLVDGAEYTAGSRTVGPLIAALSEEAWQAAGRCITRPDRPS